MRNAIIIILGIAIVIGILYFLTKPTQITNTNPVTRSPIQIQTITPAIKGRMCYEYHQIATSSAPYKVDEYLTLSASGTNLTGVKYGTQSGPDMTNGYSGTLQGVIEDANIKAVYAYSVEGSQNKEQEIYRVVNKGIEKLRYPLIETKGMLAPDTTQAYEVKLYTSIDCSEIIEK